jgi:hypothetical protein
MSDKFIETLGDLKRNGMGLYAHCAAPNVGHGSQLDLEALIGRLGEDHVYIDDRRLASVLVCSKCGHRGAQLTVMANTRTRTLSEA